MSRFLSTPFDIQCLTIQHLTDWLDIQTILRLYSSNTTQYQRAADCVRQILRNSTEPIDQKKFNLEELVRFHNLEVVNHLVNIELGKLSILNHFNHLRELTVTLINAREYDRVIDTFFQSPFRQQVGHLIFYGKPQPFINLSNLDVSDYNFICANGTYKTGF